MLEVGGRGSIRANQRDEDNLEKILKKALILDEAIGRLTHVPRTAHESNPGPENDRQSLISCNV